MRKTIPRRVGARGGKGNGVTAAKVKAMPGESPAPATHPTAARAVSEPRRYTRPADLSRQTLFAKRRLTENGVFERFCRAETHDCLRLDLDRFASLRIAAHARLPVRLHRASDVRNDEFARSALGFLDRQLEQFFEELRRDFLRRPDLVGHVRDDLGLAHWFCHLVSFSSPELIMQARRPASKST